MKNHVGNGVKEKILIEITLIDYRLSRVIICSMKNLHKTIKYIGLAIILLIVIFFIWQGTKSVPTEGNWKDTLRLLSTAEFNGDLVTVKNVRNFQYSASGTPTVEDWYDKTYDLNKLQKVWYAIDPFDPSSLFAHTFLSFQFSDGSFLAITIEARLTKTQEYNMWNGFIRSFPLMYIAADERDAVYLRTNIYKDSLYVYPLRANPHDARLLLVDMLNRMNDIAIHPTWYNAIYANCTSSIASHVNKIWPGLLPKFDWQVLFTSYADKLALDKGLLDTDLSLNPARKKFYVTDIAGKVGYVKDFSDLIRKFSLGK